MRIAAIPFILLASGCGMFSDAGSTMADGYADCISNYEGWAEDIKEGEDDEEFLAVFDETAVFGQERFFEFFDTTLQLGHELDELDKDEKKERYGELVDLLDDPEADCKDAKEDYREELDDNEDACKAYFDWEEDQEDEWEKWDEEEDERDEKCEEKEEEGKSCYTPTVFMFKAVSHAPGPLKANSKEDCED
jgi:hypothetical protein